MIDASTCMFPAQTWFFKGLAHVGTSYGSEYNVFVLWLLTQTVQPTVRTAERYPQFMTTDLTQMTLSAL